VASGDAKPVKLLATVEEALLQSVTRRIRAHSKSGGQAVLPCPPRGRGNFELP